MAACRSLRHTFENPLPENPTLPESLSLSQIKPIKPIEQSFITEIFGKLHFEESPDLFFPLSASSSSSLDSVPQKDTVRAPESKGHSNSIRGSESLQLCTEGLGFESSHDFEEVRNGMNENWEVLNVKEGIIPIGNSSNGENYRKRSRGSVGETQAQYPPPISCIGETGKPWVCFRSYRDNGRFVLKTPTKEFLHAHRENGRLRLNFVQPYDDDEEEYYDDDVFLQEEADEEEENEQEAEEDRGNGESDASEIDRVNIENGFDAYDDDDESDASDTDRVNIENGFDDDDDEDYDDYVFLHDDDDDEEEEEEEENEQEAGEDRGNGESDASEIDRVNIENGFDAYDDDDHDEDYDDYVFLQEEAEEEEEENEQETEEDRGNGEGDASEIDRVNIENGFDV